MKRIFSIITAVLMTVICGSSVALAEENAVYPSELNAGRYEIEAVGSHSELIVEKCMLNSSGNSMTAEMTMLGDKVTALYLGSASSAESAQNVIYPEKDENGKLVFTIRVEMLDGKITCAAYNEEEHEWNDRMLLFKSGSLPENAFRKSENSGNVAVYVIVAAAVVVAAGVVIYISKRGKGKNNE